MIKRERPLAIILRCNIARPWGAPRALNFIPTVNSTKTDWSLGQNALVQDKLQAWFARLRQECRACEAQLAHRARATRGGAV